MVEKERKPKSEQIDHIPEVPAAEYEAAYKAGWLERARGLNPNFGEFIRKKRGRKSKNRYDN